MSKDTRFAHYRQLLSRVDEKFSEIHAKHPQQFQCGRGCFGCCKSGLTVTHVEAEHIRTWLKSHPDRASEIKASIVADHHGDRYCKFLAQDGSCQIYEVRPVVCRSHGAPLLIPVDDDSGDMDGDICPLNFAEFDLQALPQADWIRIDTLNTILVKIDIEFDRSLAGQRLALDFGLLD